MGTIAIHSIIKSVSSFSFCNFKNDHSRELDGCDEILLETLSFSFDLVHKSGSEFDYFFADPVVIGEGCQHSSSCRDLTCSRTAVMLREFLYLIIWNFLDQHRLRFHATTGTEVYNKNPEPCDSSLPLVFWGQNEKAHLDYTM